ncbi:hypothetical protein FKV24_008030 [Lysobacter maris]|uniref:Uncharacterized protein n=1 Tax=Marilutibacter maris TaxID=1605891 RepID=A0A508AR65_9GAMM|nr:hypothetical protein [Lysobacter maris]KAB8191347.1 hypothetical protein FKV24_008030 [Lysobacter maris]
MTTQHISQVMADLAWDRYEEASARVSRFLSGAQLDLYDPAPAEAREWLGIAVACDREALRHGR